MRLVRQSMPDKALQRAVKKLSFLLSAETGRPPADPAFERLSHSYERSK